MAITASIGAQQGGDSPYAWTMEYDDVTQRVTAQATGAGNIVVDVQVTAAGGIRRVSFVQPGRAAFPGSDYTVTIGTGQTVIGPVVPAAQVARIVGKIGTAVGGLPFSESWSST